MKDRNASGHCLNLAKLRASSSRDGPQRDFERLWNSIGVATAVDPDMPLQRLELFLWLFRLLEIEKREGITQAWLAEQMGVTDPTVSRNLDALERYDWMATRKKKGDDDGRLKVLKISSWGRKKLRLLEAPLGKAALR